jgi:RNA polymerase sigma-70 factor (ECF subfamily)
MADGTTVRLQRCLDRLLDGNAQAREELIACAADRLTKLAQRMFQHDGRLERWEETADVAQGALLRLWRALQDVRPASLREFFRLAAVQIRREMLDLARHHFGPEGAARFHASVSPALPAETTSVLEQRAERADLSHEPSHLAAWAEFHELAADLPEEIGEVFDLVFYQGLSHAEAASLLGVSKKTVQRRWQEGCVRIHTALGDRLPGL